MSQKMKLFILYSAVVALAVIAAAYVVSPRKPAPELYASIERKLTANPASLFTFDPDISYRLKPGFTGKRHDKTSYLHQTNSRGLLAADEISAHDTRKKILFLGDSVAYGDGVAFDRITISQMQRMAGGNYLLANGSCPGWSTRQELVYYRKYLSDIKWDAIVIFFCLNDLLNFEWVYDAKDDFKMSAELENIGGLTGFKDKAVESVRIWRIRGTFEADPKLQPLAEHSNTCLFAWDTGKWESFNRDVLSPFLTSPNRPPVIMVAMPSLLQLLARQTDAPDSTVYFPQQKLRSYSNIPRVVFIDASEAFSSRTQNPKSAYLDRDYLHFSEQGHALMSAYLWPQIEKQSRHFWQDGNPQ